MELSLHRWPYAGRAFRRASVPPLLGGLLTFSLSLMAVGIVVYAGAVPSLAEQSPLVRQWAGADRARALGPDAPLMGVHGLSGTRRRSFRSRRREWPGGNERHIGRYGFDN